MNIKSNIEQFLQGSLAALNVTDVHVIVSPSDDAVHGEYTTNIAMMVAKKLGKSPMEVGEEIKEIGNREWDMGGVIEKIEVVRPGFINFFVTKEELGNVAKDVLEGKKAEIEEKKKVMVEFTDPNPFKEFHIGHLYSNIVGESISRLFGVEGNEVIRVCYQGDVGLHVAKAIWGMQKKLQIANGEWQMDKVLGELEKTSLKERAQLLGEAYASGAKVYEEDATAKKEIIEINKHVYARDDEQINTLYDHGKKWSLEYFDSMYERLGTKFKRFYFESEVAPDGIAIVQKGLQDGIFTKENGAVIFKGEQYSLHTRVFLNSLGLPTYEAKELGLAVKKEKELAPDLSVIITGNEIKEYFKVLLKVSSLINPEIEKKTHHITHGMVRLADGKMSSRLGNVLTGEWLLNETKKRLSMAFPDMNEATLEDVTIGAVKYALLKGSIGHDIGFDFDESISFDGNSGPYLQYTYVRTQSVLSKWQMANDELDTAHINFSSYSFSPEESSLLRTIAYFQEVVSQAAATYSPHLLCTYLFGLAQTFNLFYQKQPILKAKKEQQEMRVFLVMATARVLKDGLELLGINAPERM